MHVLIFFLLLKKNERIQVKTCDDERMHFVYTYVTPKRDLLKPLTSGTFHGKIKTTSSRQYTRFWVMNKYSHTCLQKSGETKRQSQWKA